jgi:hypothetical protein
VTPWKKFLQNTLTWRRPWRPLHRAGNASALPEIAKIARSAKIARIEPPLPEAKRF